VFGKFAFDYGTSSYFDTDDIHSVWHDVVCVYITVYIDRDWNFTHLAGGCPKNESHKQFWQFCCYCCSHCVVLIDRWYHGRIERDVAEKLLKESGQDSFLVRESVAHPGDYTIAVHLHENAITSIRVDYKVAQWTSEHHVTFETLDSHITENLKIIFVILHYIMPLLPLLLLFCLFYFFCFGSIFWSYFCNLVIIWWSCVVYVVCTFFGLLSIISVLLPSVLWRCWLGGRKGIRPVKKRSGEVMAWLSVWNEVQTCMLHMAQLKPLPLTVSCFSKIQFGFAFLVPAHPGSPGKRAVKRVCVKHVCFYYLW